MKVGRMKDEREYSQNVLFILTPSSFILAFGRGGQN